MAANSNEISTRGTILDRLIDRDPFVGKKNLPKTTISVEDLKRSVIEELQRLLNTRCSISIKELEEQERSVINYGVPDFSNFFPDSAENRHSLEAYLTELFCTYEPRLSNVSVKVERFQKGGGTPTLAAYVEALLMVDPICERVSFVLSTDDSSDEKDSS